MNHGTELRTLRPLLDHVTESRAASKRDLSDFTVGKIVAPTFQNFASILNIQDFQGAIEVKDCTMS